MALQSQYGSNSECWKIIDLTQHVSVGMVCISCNRPVWFMWNFSLSETISVLITSTRLSVRLHRCWCHSNKWHSSLWSVSRPLPCVGCSRHLHFSCAVSWLSQGNTLKMIGKISLTMLVCSGMPSVSRFSCSCWESARAGTSSTLSPNWVSIRPLQHCKFALTWLDESIIHLMFRNIWILIAFTWLVILKRTSNSQGFVISWEHGTLPVAWYNTL